MIFFHFFIFLNLVTVTDRGVKVGQDDQKLVRMTNLTITPPNLAGFEAALLKTNVIQPMYVETKEVIKKLLVPATDIALTCDI